MAEPKVTIHAKDEILNFHIFHGFKVTFQYLRFDGKFSEPATHFVLERGDSVAVLLHDVPTDEIILVEQFRISTAENGTGWLIELPAGKVDDGESTANGAIREAKEETGAIPSSVHPISTFYLSPGSSSERLHLFYCPFENGISVQEFGGMAHEGEDIRVHRMAAAKAIAVAESGEIADAKTLVALFWLQGKRGG